MTIHVNIGKAKANLSKLISASLRGEEVVIDHDGKPQVRLTPVVEAQAVDRDARRTKIDEILARVDALPIDRSSGGDLEWDENGLPI
ncbi:antitoxin [Novosphingobium sp.]|uniref:type II toxin-antitoxin system Phd/YefM family antitoxin n=1 Tax=Novosphingobium sp. TaxID=1874826 RepID=UPI00286CE0E8|nr:antitoxin [Novosphingobium sp.]